MPQRFMIKRILVALDASPNSLAALDAAVDLAVRFQAELVGLYVEDENLLRVADLPYLSEIGVFTATRRHISGMDLERQLRVQTRRVRRLFALTTRRAQVRWTFQAVRGAVLAEVLSAARDADVLVLGRSGWSLMRRGRLGSTVRGILPERFGLALILKEETCLGAPFMVVYDGSPAAGRALIAADTFRRQSDDDRQPLIVLLLAEDVKRLQALKSQAASLLEHGNASDEFRFLTRANVPQLVDILHTSGCGTLVAPAQSSALQSGVLATLMEQVDFPVLLVT